MLPLLISVPHAGLTIPENLRHQCALTPDEIAQDGDEGAREAYAPMEAECAHFVTSDVARAALDLNRPEDDRSKDGVVKTHTCWDVPVWTQPLSADQIEQLLQDHHRPYHRELTNRAGKVKLGIDCHTMAAQAPPVAPDVGQERPAVCLSNLEGKSCPNEWLVSLAQHIEEELGHRVSCNAPFKGGYITRAHGSEMPWMQLELSRAPFMSWPEKGTRILRALNRWCSGQKWV